MHLRDTKSLKKENVPEKKLRLHLQYSEIKRFPGETPEVPLQEKVIPAEGLNSFACIMISVSWQCPYIVRQPIKRR